MTPATRIDMTGGSGAEGRVRATIAALKQRLARSDAEAEAEAAARRLDAEEVGRRADERHAEREAAAGPSKDDPPSDR